MGDANAKIVKESVWKEQAMWEMRTSVINNNGVILLCLACASFQHKTIRKPG